jgi:D-glycero-D-manno-heptose 1,7-bisphosphate phosphatase
MRPALLLDRDGVINIDRTYVSRIEEFTWQPGIFDLARTAVQRGLVIVVVTNQSGIGRGYYTEDDYQLVTAHMRARFDAEQAPVAAVYHCPFHPEAEVPLYRNPDHPWRKPRPGMILAARDDLDLDLARSILIGDRWSDIAAGAAAGVGILAVIGNPVGPKPDGMSVPVFQFLTVSDAAQWLAKLPQRVPSA